MEENLHFVQTHHTRPLLHYSPKHHWMNDPNGCIYHEGLYHLFYQYYPQGTQWGPMHWGHASSTDLLHWEELPIALYPNEEFGYIFSGSVIADTHNTSSLFSQGSSGLVAVYTTNRPAQTSAEPILEDKEHHQVSVQQQCISYSTDGGRTWEQYAGNPVLPNPGIPHFRDPKVFFHEGSSAWIMILAAGSELHLYRSQNLMTWEITGIIPISRTMLLQEPSSHPTAQPPRELILECPELFPLRSEDGTKAWVLVFSVWDNTKQGTAPMYYTTGDFDGWQFTAEWSNHPGGELSESMFSSSIRRVDFGDDFYAAQSWNYSQTPDPALPHEQQETKIWIAWANHWAYADTVPTYPWRGIMSLPRELSLRPIGTHQYLIQQPVSQLDSVPCSHTVSLTDIRSGEIPFDAALVYDIQMTLAKAARCSLRWAVTTEDPDEELIISWDGQTRTCKLDRHLLKGSGFHPLYEQITTLQVPCTLFTRSERDDASPHDTLSLRVVLDRGIVEIFISGGAVVCTSQLFPNALWSGTSFELTGEGCISEISCKGLDPK